MATRNTKITPGAVLNTFISNVNNIILSGAYEQINPPKFSGRTVYNNAETNINTSTAYNNPVAIPTSDLDNKSNSGINGLSIGRAGEPISGATIYNTLYNIVRKLTRVRAFTSSWYHKTQDSYTFIDSSSGKAVFRELLPSIVGKSNAKNNTASGGWERSVNGYTTQVFNISNPGIAKNSIISAENIDTFFNNMITAWNNLTLNKINYTFYSCHNNCHSNCHESCHSAGRSRR